MNKRSLPCTIPGCGKRINSRGWCSMHYERWRLYGTTDTPRQSMADRLMAKVVGADSGGCWSWTGSLDRAGYGKFCEGGRGNTRFAHRVSYELFVGPIPDGLQLDHLCRNRACINPDHLEPVTAKVNVHRSHNPAVVAHLSGICMSGNHEMTEANTYVHPSSGARNCIECRRAYHRRHYAAQRRALIGGGHA